MINDSSRGPMTRGWLLVAMAWFATATAAMALTFEPLGHTGGMTSEPSAVSADGSVVVGRVFEEVYNGQGHGSVDVFRWQAGTMQAPLAGCSGSDPRVSDDGRTVAGYCRFASFRPAVWKDGALVEVSTDTKLTATEVSGDGNVVFGHRSHVITVPFGEDLKHIEAARLSGGVTPLGILPGDNWSEVIAVSRDGSVVGVQSQFRDHSGEEPVEIFQAARWKGGSLQDLGNLGAEGVFVTDVSSDGETIVGYLEYPSEGPVRAFRWTEATGMVDLGAPPGGDGARALGVSADGRTIVGSWGGPATVGEQAMIWTEAGGARDLQGMLANDLGYDLGGWTLIWATAISGDASTIVGTGVDPTNGHLTGWIAALRGLDFSFDAVTRERGHVALDETVRYTAIATPSVPVVQLRITIDLPRDTTVVDGSISQGGRLEGAQLVWDFVNTSGETVSFDLLVGAQQPGTLFVSSQAGVLAAFGGGGEARADREIALRYGESAFDIADAHPDELGGLLLPNADNARALPTLDFSELRFVNGVAADGVALLLVRARIPRKNHGKLILSLSQEQYAGAETGDLWAVDDASPIDTTADGGARDQIEMSGGVVSMALESEPNRAPGARKGEQVAFALYRSPRNFDAGDATAGVNERGVVLRLDIYDRKNKKIDESREFELRVVRPLVVLQHGTFDSPAGWDDFPLWRRGGSQPKKFYGFDQEYPFQVARSTFHQVQGAAGRLVNSAPVAYRSLLAGLAHWREITGFAGSQADVICHSYGGVNMRWAAQLQADPSPVTVHAESSFRNAGNWGHGSFHKLITIASTHRGSAVSNQLAYLNQSGLLPGAIRKTAEFQEAWIDRGGVEDQMVVSPILRLLRKTRVPGHAIAGAGLAHFNGSYQQRLASLWGADAVNGPFRQFGPPFNYIDDTLVWSPPVLRQLATYGFNLDGLAVQDDTSQNPNFDLTVSSYSSKAGMPRAAISDYRDVEDTAGLARDALNGPLTHGDEIGMGGGSFFPMLATARRVGFLLRQPTTSTYFAAFPAVTDMPLTLLERTFSDESRFPPTGLYREITGVIGSVQTQSLLADATTAPALTVVPDGTSVRPGDTLTVTVSWPGVGIQAGILAFPGPKTGAGGALLLQPDRTTHTIVVPNRNPGEFTVGATVVGPSGEAGTVSRVFELIDPVAYAALRTDPEILTMRSDTSAPFQVLGKLPSGEWRTLNDSPRLALISSDAAIASIDADGMVLPGAYGTAVITATFDGMISTQLRVEVSGAVVPAAAGVRKGGRVRRKSKKPSDFVFLSAPGFDPATIDAASVRIAGLTPVKVKQKDVNKDSVKDLLAFVSLRSLQLPAGTARIALTAKTTAGGRVAGQAAARLK